jgi:hypothetical protein
VECESALHEPREHQDLIRVLLHWIGIFSGGVPQINLLLPEEFTVDKGEDVNSLQFCLLPLLRRVRRGGADDDCPTSPASSRLLFFDAPVFVFFVREDFILPVMSVFTRIRSGAAGWRLRWRCLQIQSTGGGGSVYSGGRTSQIYLQNMNCREWKTLSGSLLFTSPWVGRFSAADSAWVRLTLQLLVLETLNLGGSTTIARFGGFQHTKDPLRTHSTVKITLQFERRTRLKARGLRAMCPLVLSLNLWG